ncbi:MAG: glycosyltransferase [Planctomycetota bacterium]
MPPRLLLLTHRRPTPPDRGDRIRSHAWLTGLSQYFEISLACADAVKPSLEDQQVLDRHTARHAHARIDPERAQRQAVLSLVSGFIPGGISGGTPGGGGGAGTPAAFFDRALCQTLLDWDRAQPFDAVLTFCTGMAKYTHRLFADRSQRNLTPPRHVLDLVDVDSQKWARYAQHKSIPVHRRLAARLEAKRLTPYEAGRAVPFDHLVVTSPHEADLYTQHVTDQHQPIPIDNGVDLARFPQAPPIHALPPDARQTFLFTGVLDYPPNTAAVERFAKHILPKIQAQHPGARFRIVGRHPPDAWRRQGLLSALPGVDLIGPVDDIAAEHARAAVAIAPLRFAPGVQNKVLEAMAVGRAVVCSPGAAQGLDANPNEHLVTSESDDDFAAACITLLNNPEQSQALGDAARHRIADRYAWAPRIDRLAELLR